MTINEFMKDYEKKASIATEIFWGIFVGTAVFGFILLLLLFK